MSSVVSAASPRKKLRCGCPPTMNKRIKYHVPTSKESNLKAIRTLELIFLWALSSESIKVRVRHYTCFFIPSTSIALFWLFYCCIQKSKRLKDIHDLGAFFITRAIWRLKTWKEFPTFFPSLFLHFRACLRFLFRFGVSSSSRHSSLSWTGRATRWMNAPNEKCGPIGCIYEINNWNEF